MCLDKKGPTPFLTFSAVSAGIAGAKNSGSLSPISPVQVSELKMEEIFRFLEGVGVVKSSQAFFRDSGVGVRVRGEESRGGSSFGGAVEDGVCTVILSSEELDCGAQPGLCYVTRSLRRSGWWLVPATLFWWGAEKSKM